MLRQCGRWTGCVIRRAEVVEVIQLLRLLSGSGSNKRLAFCNAVRRHAPAGLALGVSERRSRTASRHHVALVADNVLDHEQVRSAS